MSKPLLSSSYEKDFELYQQSNKNSNSKHSKNSKLSDYYPDSIKHSAKFGSESNSLIKITDKEHAMCYQVKEEESQVINDYMLPSNNSQA